MEGESIHCISPAKQRSTVYVVKIEDGTRKKRTLHMNLLLPIECLGPEFQRKPIPKPRARKQQKDTNQNEKDTELKQQNDMVNLDTSDSEYDIEVVKEPVQKNSHRDFKEPVKVVEEEVTCTQPESEAAEDLAPQDEEENGSEPDAEIELRKSARVTL